MKKNVVFVDKQNTRFQIEFSYERCGDNSNIYFAFSGHGGGSSGQCDEKIVPANEAQEKLIRLWNEVHLKYPENDTQRDLLFNEVDELYEKIRGFEKERVEQKRIELFGQDFEDFLFLHQEVEAVSCIYGTDYLFSKTDCERIFAIMYAFDVSFVDAVAGLDYNGNGICFHMEWYGQDLYVGTEEECKDEMENRKDEYKELWIEAVRANNTERGFDDWFEDIVEQDWRSCLDTWDGYGDEVLLGNEYYYVLQA